MVDVCGVFNKLAVVELVDMLIWVELLLQLLSLFTDETRINLIFFRSESLIKVHREYIEIIYHFLARVAFRVFYLLLASITIK